MDAVAWPAEQPVTNISEEGNKQEEGTVEAMQREADDEGHHIKPLFLSPDRLSFYDEYTEVSSGGSTRGKETYTTLKITDPPATSGRATEQLLVDLLLIVAFGKLIAVPVLNGEIGKPLAQINLVDGPVMVQWAIGNYVDAWTKELAPYFQAYSSDEARRDPKLNNGEGLTFMQRHQPGSAVGWFVGAAMGDPTNAEYANNAGFAYYQLGKYEESVLWLEKTISIDPNRAVAYLNLGDAYAKLKRHTKARQAYTKYLGLAPDSKSAPKVKEKLAALPPSS